MSWLSESVSVVVMHTYIIRTGFVHRNSKDTVKRVKIRIKNCLQHNVNSTEELEQLVNHELVNVFGQNLIGVGITSVFNGQTPENKYEVLIDAYVNSLKVKKFQN